MAFRSPGGQWAIVGSGIWMADIGEFWNGWSGTVGQGTIGRRASVTVRLGVDDGYTYWIRQGRGPRSRDRAAFGPERGRDASDRGRDTSESDPKRRFVSRDARSG
ncbi:hypothetical protein C450_03992 [Halococcus salifodinae DSM 8989]|uniref:Uncharacterized protein n=1 Tax=Halococcus salifodinae DSM 8989 TaxID=1227456 RepID=M0NES5_9EURY|nr:hypothetical protein C450_03992 [Halococcus salifodinae DSM 8989]